MRTWLIVALAASTSFAACTPDTADGSFSRATGTKLPGAADGRIAFLRQAAGSDYDLLYTIGADGSSEQRVASSGGPNWSPDASRFVITAFSEGSDPFASPATVSVDGSGYTALHPDPELNLFVGAWSPDGTRIAAEGFIDYKTNVDRNGLYTFRATDGGALSRVTRSGHRPDRPVAFSPDGAKIMFFRPQATSRDDNAGMDLYVVGVDGTGLTRLNPAGVMTGDPTIGPSASWSPDGTEVTFVGSDGSFWDDRRAVFIVNTDGSDARRTTGWSDPIGAKWSPDGAWIAFSKADLDEDAVFVIRPDGTGLHAVTTRAEGVFSFGPVWSPDGQKLLFVRGSDLDLVDLWTVNLDGSAETQLTHEPAQYEQYSWAAAAVP